MSKSINGSTNIFLANVIYYFHIFIVLFMVFVPFTNIPSLLILHIVSGICLLIHWKLNSNVCSLTILEAKLRGIDRVHTFTHEFIAPIYDISSTSWSHVCSILTILLVYISFIKILNNKSFKNTWDTCKKIYNSKNDSNPSIEKSKIAQYIECIKPLFQFNVLN